MVHFIRLKFSDIYDILKWSGNRELLILYKNSLITTPTTTTTTVTLSTTLVCIESIGRNWNGRFCSFVLTPRLTLCILPEMIKLQNERKRKRKKNYTFLSKWIKIVREK